MFCCSCVCSAWMEGSVVGGRAGVLGAGARLNAGVGGTVMLTGGGSKSLVHVEHRLVVVDLLHLEVHHHGASSQ